MPHRHRTAVPEAVACFCQEDIAFEIQFLTISIFQTIIFLPGDNNSLQFVQKSALFELEIVLQTFFLKVYCDTFQ